MGGPPSYNRIMTVPASQTRWGGVQDAHIRTTPRKVTKSGCGRFVGRRRTRGAPPGRGAAAEATTDVCSCQKSANRNAKIALGGAVGCRGSSQSEPGVSPVDRWPLFFRGRRAWTRHAATRLTVARHVGRSPGCLRPGGSTARPLSARYVGRSLHKGPGTPRNIRSMTSILQWSLMPGPPRRGTSGKCITHLPRRGLERRAHRVEGGGRVRLLAPLAARLPTTAAPLARARPARRYESRSAWQTPVAAALPLYAPRDSRLSLERAPPP